MRPHYSIAGALGVALLALALSACGGTGEPGAPPVATLEPTATSALAAPEGGVWRTDVTVGAAVGNVAPATSVLLRDGSAATLEEIADGRPLLLYFFATW